MGLKLMAEVGLDGAGFERGLKRMGDAAGASVKNFAMQAFGVYGIEQAISKTVETATDLVNESKRLDLTVEQLQLLRQAAKDGGIEMDALAGAFEKLDIARAKALAGDQTAMNAFAKLGVDKTELQTQTAAALFMGPISQTAKAGNAEDLAPVLKDVFGKAFGEIIPVLKTDFEELGDKMRKLGSIMDADTAVKLKAIGENFDLLKNILAVQLGPVLLSVVEIFLQIIGKVQAFGAFLGALSEKGVLKAGAAVARELDQTKFGKIWDPTAIVSGFADKIGTKQEGDQLISQAGQAFIDQDKETQEQLKAIKDKLAEEAKTLEHPKPIAAGDDDPKVKAAKVSHAATDSLVKVGNFLGSNGNTISRVDQMKLKHLETIANNTKPHGWTSAMLLGIQLPANL